MNCKIRTLGLSVRETSRVGNAQNDSHPPAHSNRPAIANLLSSSREFPPNAEQTQRGAGQDTGAFMASCTVSRVEEPRNGAVREVLPNTSSPQRENGPNSTHIRSSGQISDNATAPATTTAESSLRNAERNFGTSRQRRGPLRANGNPYEGMQDGRERALAGPVQVAGHEADRDNVVRGHRELQALLEQIVAFRQLWSRKLDDYLLAMSGPAGADLFSGHRLESDRHQIEQDSVDLLTTIQQIAMQISHVIPRARQTI